jgi:hypothetical protein
MKKESLKKEGQSKQDMTRVTRQRSSDCLIKESARGPLPGAVITPQLYSFLVALGKSKANPRVALTNFTDLGQLQRPRRTEPQKTLETGRHHHFKFCGRLPANFVSWEDHFPM